MSDGRNVVPRLVAAAVLIVVACVAESRAEDRKADAAPDLSTARSAALAWIDASWAGNASVAHQVLVDDEQQRKFMEGPLRFNAALSALREAAVKHFGEAGREVTGYPDGSARAMDKHLDIKEEGDSATASLKVGMMPLQLRRIDGKWRVDLGAAVRDPRARRASEASIAAAKAAKEVTAEIADGKYKAAEEAKAAFRERRLASVRPPE